VQVSRVLREFTALHKDAWAASLATDSTDVNGKGMKRRRAGGNAGCSLTATQRPSLAPGRKHILSRREFHQRKLTPEPAPP